MLTVLPPALLSVPLPALNVPRASLNEIALVELLDDDTEVNCRFIPVPLPLMLMAPPEVLLIAPSVKTALPTLVPESANTDEEPVLPISMPSMVLPLASTTAPLMMGLLPVAASSTVPLTVSPWLC